MPDKIVLHEVDRVMASGRSPNRIVTLSVTTDEGRQVVVAKEPVVLSLVSRIADLDAQRQQPFRDPGLDKSGDPDVRFGSLHEHPSVKRARQSTGRRRHRRSATHESSGHSVRPGPTIQALPACERIEVGWGHDQRGRMMVFVHPHAQSRDVDLSPFGLPADALQALVAKLQSTLDQIGQSRRPN